VTLRLKPRYPRIARTVLAFMHTTPTEACAERGFSTLKWIADDYRANLGEETAASLLIAASCHTFLKKEQQTSSVPRQSVSTSVDREPRRKKNRAETPASPDPHSPVPAQDQPEVLVVDEVDADEEDEEEEDDDSADDEPIVGSMLQTIVDHYIAKFSNRPHEDVVRGPPAARTRKTVDTCALCNKACKEHEEAKAYVACSCGKRASVKCVKGLPLHRIKADLNRHDKVEVTWLCPDCDPLAGL
jgi:hypothetical protein